MPSGDVRIDSAVEEGGEVTPFYDPMIAKLIVHAPTREQAAAALADACAAVEVHPVRTNAAFLARAAADADFVAGRIDTGFIPARQKALAAARPLSQGMLDDFATDFREQLVCFNSFSEGILDSVHLTGFRLNAVTNTGAVLWVDGERRLAALSPSTTANFSEAVRPWLLFEDGEAHVVDVDPPLSSGPGGAASDGKLLAPMPGRVVQLAVAAGQRVAKGAPVVTLEAMKMEHGLTAPFDAIVAEAPVSVGQQVSEGALLVRLERAEG